MTVKRYNMTIKRILVINPNSSPKLTNILDVIVNDRISRFQSGARIETYTAPSGPPSIDNDDDALMSAKAVMADLQFRLEEYDAYLVACYSVHPLVGMLKARVSHRIHVTGIFEASISTALSLVSTDSESKYGIITSSEYWVNALTDSVHKYCGIEDSKNKRFKGVVATGLTADDFSDLSSEEIKIRVKKATIELVKDRDIRVICIGCTDMAGYHGTIVEALEEELRDQAKSVYILDGVHAGIGLIESLLRAFPT